MIAGGGRGLRRPVLITVLAVAVGLAGVACSSKKGSGSGSQAQSVAANNVAGLPITHGDSGLKPGAPSPDLQVKGDANTEDDKLAEASIADVQAYWKDQLPADFDMTFKPVEQFYSYDSNGPDQKIGCDQNGKGQYNAFYCGSDDSISWDRGGLLPDLRESQGPITVVAVLAHEFGHAIQFRLGDKAGMGKNVPTIVKEQQADCFAGSYFRWVAEGKSQYISLSTAEGLNSVIVAMLHLRDEVGSSATKQGAHGSGFDRTYALRAGFEKGPKECAGMNMDNISARVTEKALLKGDATTSKGDTKVNESSVGELKKSLDEAFKGVGAQAPEIKDAGGQCSGGDKSTPPASYCQGDNTISIDMSTLATMAQPIDHEAEVTGKKQAGRGDFAAFGEIASRYALAMQKGAGASVDGPNTGLRTACLVGAWAQFASSSQKTGSAELRLSPGDLDEAIGEMLEENSVIAADVNGEAPTVGFDRVSAMQEGYLQGSSVCSKSYP